MSGVEGYEHDEFVGGDTPGDEHETTGEPFDAEAHAAESAEHDKFLETYQPVITRLPEALQIEAEARAEEVKAERVQTLITDLGISEDEARVQVYGPDVADAHDAIDDEALAVDEDGEE